MQKAVRIIAIIAVVVFLGFLTVRGLINSEKAAKEAWNVNMTLGQRETAENFYYDYTDIMCPYCDKFSLAISKHKDEFMKDYIEGKKIYFELRLTDLLYVYHKNESEGAINSRNAAMGAYCAADQAKFWDYYYAILDKLYDDYFSKGIGVDRNAQKIPKLEHEYFKSIIEKIADLDMTKFNQCYDQEEKAAEIDKNTNRATRAMSQGAGVPYFVFNKYVANGFDGKWDAENYDWNQAKLMLDAGLSKK